MVFQVGNEDQLTHGHARRENRSATYSAWASMLQRTKTKEYKNVFVCERWFTFENFLEDMKECPSGLTLERVDNNGNYEPSNCKWASREDQARNRSTTILTFEEAVEIAKERKATGNSYQSIADKWGLSKSLIVGICLGKKWKGALDHLDSEGE